MAGSVDRYFGLCAYFWLTNQEYGAMGERAQRRDAQFGVLFAGLLKLPVMFIIVLPGVFAAILFPGMTEPDRIYRFDDRIIAGWGDGAGYGRACRCAHVKYGQHAARRFDHIHYGF